MSYDREQDVIEQLEVIADVPDKSNDFERLAEKMPQTAVVDFFRVFNKYFNALENYWQDSDKKENNEAHIARLRSLVQNAERIVNEILENNPNSIAGRYLKVLIDAKFQFDEQRNPTFTGGAEKWLQEAVEDSKALAANGFGPAVKKYLEAGIVSPNEQVQLLAKGIENGSLTCKSLLAQRYFSSLLNNASQDAPNDFAMPENMNVQRLVGFLHEAIEQNDNASAAYLTRFLSDVTGALRAIAQQHHSGASSISSIQLEKLHQLAEIAKELSTINGDTSVAEKIDGLVDQAQQTAERFQQEKQAIISNPKVMDEIRQEVEQKSNEIFTPEALNKIDDKHMQQLWQEQGRDLMEKEHEKLSQAERSSNKIYNETVDSLYEKLTSNDPTVLQLFKNQPGVQKELSSPRHRMAGTLRRFISNPTTQSGMTADMIKSVVPSQEIARIIKENAFELTDRRLESDAEIIAKSKLEPFALAATKNEVSKEKSKLTDQVISERASATVKQEFSALKQSKEQTTQFIEQEFSGTLAQRLDEPRTAITSAATSTRERSPSSPRMGSHREKTKEPESPRLAGHRKLPPNVATLHSKSSEFQEKRQKENISPSEPKTDKNHRPEF